MGEGVGCCDIPLVLIVWACFNKPNGLSVLTSACGLASQRSFRIF